LRLIGPNTNSQDDVDLNDLKVMDLNATCFMMLTIDLPILFGIIVCTTNLKVKVNDLEQFDNWLHVISNPIVVNFFVGETIV